MNSFRHAVLSAALTAGVFHAGSAFAAPDPVAVADRLVEMIAVSGSQASYESAVYNPANDVVTVLNFKISDGDGTGTFATVSVKGYDEDNTDGFGADDITATGFELVDDDAQVFISSMTVTGLSIPSLDVDPEDPKSWENVKYSSAEFANINAIPKGSVPITVASVKSTAIYTGDDGISGKGTLTIDDLSVPASFMENEAKTFMDASGYESLILDVSIDAAYDAAGQTLDLNKMTFDAQDMGVINFSANLGGMVDELLRDPEQIQGLMATATLRSASLSFANNSIFEKGLDFAAKMTGQDASQLKAQAPFVLGFALAQINNEAFTKMVTEAVTKFLDSPNSLSVTIAPENPVPVAQIAGAAMSSPQVVPDLLSVTVEANQ
ncbi:hypothetical protein [Pararhizobium sp. IMCC21322]|uniref:hypothetical protein n=1 Tax=Pararhizobium sp. IMCC21322 TaxID=3067903 RepID=UPI002741A564|nr:hypothetical protein [Pararhizobium sp. IMCC21322]